MPIKLLGEALSLGAIQLLRKKDLTYLRHPPVRKNKNLAIPHPPPLFLRKKNKKMPTPSPHYYMILERKSIKIYYFLMTPIPFGSLIPYFTTPYNLSS